MSRIDTHSRYVLLAAGGDFVAPFPTHAQQTQRIRDIGRILKGARPTERIRIDRVIE